MDAFTFVLESLDDTARLGTLLAGMMQNAPQVRQLAQLLKDAGCAPCFCKEIWAAAKRP